MEQPDPQPDSLFKCECGDLAEWYLSDGQLVPGRSFAACAKHAARALSHVATENRLTVLLRRVGANRLPG